YKGLISDQVKQATGRDLAIKGELKLAIGLSPAVAVEDVTFSNASWGSRPHMAQIKRFEAQVALLPLIWGNINVRRLVLIDPDIVLETDAKGKGNWEFDTAAKPTAPATPAASSAPGALPTFNAVEIRNAKVLYRDGKTKESKQLTIAHALLRADSETSPLNIDIEGQLDAIKFKLSGDAGSLAAMSRPGTPAPVKLAGEIADVTTFKLEGIVREPTAGKGYDLTLAAEGKELARLAELGGQKMTAFGPFKIDARVSDDAPGGKPSIRSIKAELGRKNLVLVKAEGGVRDPLNHKGISLTASVEGDEIGALSGFSAPGGLALPPVPAFGPFRVSVRVANAQGDRPTIPELRAELGTPELIKIALEGSVRDPLAQSGVALNLVGEAKDLQAVAAKLGTSAPASGPMKLAAKVRDTAPGRYAVSDLAFTAAGSDVAGEATLATTGSRPAVSASLSSTVLDMTKFSAPDGAKGGAGGAGKAPPAPAAKSDRVFSDDPLPYDALKSADADIKYKAAKFIAASGMTVQNLALSLAIKNGELNLRPLTGQVSGGTLAVDVALDANRKTFAAKIDGKSIDLGALLKSTKTTDYLDRGKSDIQVDIRGAGPSMRAVMASLNGSTTLVVGEGSIDSRVFDIAGADLTKILSPLSGGGSSGRSTLNCVVNRMDIKDGVANTRVLLTDTSTLSVVGEGAVNLGTEQLGMMLRPKAKGGSVASLAPPVRVGGTLANPSYTPDPAGTAAAIVGAVGGSGALGPIGLLGGAVAGSAVGGATSAPTCQQALAQIGAKPSVPVGSSGQPATQPVQQQQQQRQQPASPVEELQRGLKGLFGR
ncbi:MAG TPA: AsmA family protein, partial [Alphaproteobacteria bacterium]|nr:AsmA family protein [Alphaproteobacteria bacterium]